MVTFSSRYSQPDCLSEGLKGGGSGRVSTGAERSLSYELSPDPDIGWNAMLLADFQTLAIPRAPVTLDSSGNLYSMAANGGADGGGMAFEVTKRRGSPK